MTHQLFNPDIYSVTERRAYVNGARDMMLDILAQLHIPPATNNLTPFIGAISALAQNLNEVYDILDDDQIPGQLSLFEVE